MRLFAKKLTTAAVALCAISFTISEIQAAKITLDGYGYYKLKKKVKYYQSPPKQHGRYKSLGEDYYHDMSYRMDFVTNRSGRDSGSLSWEFWAMPYLGATSGIIIMTDSLEPISAGKSKKDPQKSGKGIYLDRKRFPELNIWEYTRKGWKFRDALSFTRKTWL